MYCFGGAPVAGECRYLVNAGHESRKTSSGVEVTGLFELAKILSGLT